MNHLHRELAPISAAAWAEIEREAQQTLKRSLAARRLADFIGPTGWASAAVGTGRSEPIEAPVRTGIEARLRKVLPLMELRVPFELSRAELDAVDRGAKDPDLDPLTEAARRIALAEDRAVFYGAEGADIVGIAQAQKEHTVALPADAEGFPVAVAVAINRLRQNGVSGPYAIALGERAFVQLTETTKAGYPVIEHVRRLVEGPLVWAPAVDGALVLSLRGGDFELYVGQDLSIGYLRHDAETVSLYIEESLTFWNLSPQAAVPLDYSEAAS